MEADRDREFLEWVARFRFVTVDVLSERFDVSVRQANVRVTALEAAGLVNCVRGEGRQQRLVCISRRGAVAVGLTPRRPPRPDVQRTHELAIARLAAQIDREHPGAVVLSEREAHHQEATGGERCSVTVFGSDGRRERRWPDLIVDGADRRIAVEIELAAKPSERLRRIVVAYATSRVFSEARFLVGSAPLAARIASLCSAERRPYRPGHAAPTQLAVAAWPGASERERARIDAALAKTPR